MDTPNLTILVGMIESGQDAYATWRARNGAIVVDHNELTTMLHRGKHADVALSECYRCMLEDLARQAIRAGRDVVVNGTHLNRATRRRWIDFANSVGIGPRVRAVVFTVDVDPDWYATQLRMLDPQGRSFEEWLRITRHHAKQWAAEPIGPAEGFTEISWTEISRRLYR